MRVSSSVTLSAERLGRRTQRAPQAALGEDTGSESLQLDHWCRGRGPEDPAVALQSADDFGGRAHCRLERAWGDTQAGHHDLQTSTILFDLGLDSSQNVGEPRAGVLSAGTPDEGKTRCRPREVVTQVDSQREIVLVLSGGDLSIKSGHGLSVPPAGMNPPPARGDSLRRSSTTGWRRRVRRAKALRARRDSIFS
jgi:hypothetical protein